MKKIILIPCLFLAIHFVIPAQTKGKLSSKIIIKGKVLDYSAKDYIFYTDGKGRIRYKDRIKLGKDRTYTIDLSKTEFKFAEKIYFSLDTTTDVFAQFSCFSSINLEAIRNYCIKNRLQNFVLKNDLEITFNCYNSDPPPIPENIKELGGTYIFSNNDTTWQLFLNNEFLTRFSGSFSPADKKLNNSIWGVWDYEEKKNILTLKIYRLKNTIFNTQVSTNQNWSFIITKANGNFSFRQIDGNGVLKKINSKN